MNKTLKKIALIAAFAFATRVNSVSAQTAVNPVDSAKTSIVVGDKVADGTIYTGLSPDTRKPMYAAPKDLVYTISYDTAMKQCAILDVGGNKDFRVPSKTELNYLYQIREKGALKGTFNLSGEDNGWYWSSTPAYTHLGWVQRFSDGRKDTNYKGVISSVRCLR